MPSLKALFFRQLMRWRLPKLAADVPIEHIRAALDAMSKNSRPPEGTVITPVQVEHMPSVWLTPPGADPNRVLYYLHGGAYVAGSIVSHSTWVAYIAQKIGVRVLLVEYRLAPEHLFPAAVDDAVLGYRWLLAQGVSADQIVIAGDSAGGGLTLATLVRLRDEGVPPPAAAFVMSPWTDLKGTGDSLRTRARRDPWLRPESIVPGGKKYCGADTPPDHPLVSPLYADLHGLPPILIQVGDCEILLDDSVRMADRLKKAGVTAELEVYDGMWHVFQTLGALMPESERAIASIARFTNKHLMRVRA